MEDANKMPEENMMEETGRADFEKGLKILWIIWAAMLGSLLIYVFICHQVGK
jgi:hypothetical protein